MGVFRWEPCAAACCSPCPACRVTPARWEVTIAGIANLPPPEGYQPPPPWEPPCDGCARLNGTFVLERRPTPWYLSHPGCYWAYELDPPACGEAVDTLWLHLQALTNVHVLLVGWGQRADGTSVVSWQDARPRTRPARLDCLAIEDEEVALWGWQLLCQVEGATCRVTAQQE